MANSTQTRQQFRDTYQEVTDTIIKQLEAGTVPWVKPWQSEGSASFAMPQNATTGKAYQGINIVLLWSATEDKQFHTHEWATFKQWSERKETIRKGEKCTIIVYYDTMEKEVDGEIKKIPFLKSSYVFNRSQLQSFEYKGSESTPFNCNIATVDSFVQNTQAIIEHDHSGACCYMPSKDKILMPYSYTFIDTSTRTRQEAYYSTLSHELVHWTGHISRLDRIRNKKFGDQAYVAEELIAELGAAFVCSELQITAEPREDHANYIANWLQVLQNDKTFVVKAASEASNAVAYLKGLQPKEYG